MSEREWLDEPKHPILPDSWTYQIVGLRLELEPMVAAEPYIDLTLRRGSERLSLRFWSPRDIHIDEGGPTMTGGLVILDVRGRRLEGVTVRVDDFEDVGGRVRFCARAVENIDVAPG